MQQITTIEFEHYFSAAHHLPDSVSLTTKKCLNNHGHTYAVRVFLEATKLQDDFVVDFGTIKSTIDQLDHAQILWKNDTAWVDFYKNSCKDMALVVMDVPPTAENIAGYIYELLNDAIASNAIVKEIWVSEGTQPGKINWVKYREISE